MTIHKDRYEEYKVRHDALWPEMEKEIKTHGAQNYSIFLDEQSGTLFAYVEVDDEEIWSQIAKTDTCQRWWAYMEPLMKTNPDNSPVTIELKEVFHMM